MANLISCDSYNGYIYQHSGGTSTILNYFASPSGTPWGLTYIGTDLWSCSNANSMIYRHNGVSASIVSSFRINTSPNGCNGLAYDGTNLYSITNNYDTIRRHSGTTSTISYQFSSPGNNPTGLTFMGSTNMFSCDSSVWTTYEIFMHSGGSSTILMQYSTPANPTGLAFDGSDIWSCYDYTAQIAQHISTSSSYRQVFASPSTSPAGLTYQTAADASPPTVGTNSCDDEDEDSFVANGYVYSTGGATVTKRGFYYLKGTSGTPDAGDNTIQSFGSFGTGSFDDNVTGLDDDTTYRVRAFAENSAGYGYGGTVSVSTDEDISAPNAPTNVAATDGSSTSKVTVTWTKSSGATGYRVYRDGGNVGGLLGNVATYDDTSADAPVITPGTSAASDGTSETQVALGVSGESVANGTSHSYTVKAVGPGGTSAASSANTGYRGHGTLSYQWQRSATDANASYSNITGATTDAYNDTDSPAPIISACSSVASDGTSDAHVSLSLNGEATVTTGRYFRCYLTATGASSVYSTANRGYKGVGSLTYQWQTSSADSDADYSDIVAGTTEAYDDTDAPAGGAGRYYKCVMAASGASGVTSSPDRGYRESNAPTDVAATAGTHNDKVVVTWTKSAGCDGYQVYRDDVPLGWLGDVATYDDTGADAGVITAGAATATDGDYTAKVVIGVTGESVAAGTTHTYKVRGRIGASETPDSATDDGNRGVGSITYQWQRSGDDSNEDYSNIAGATTEDYDDTEAPE